MSQLFKTTCKLITHGVDPPAIVTIETTSSSKTTVDKDNYTLVRNLTPAEHYERKMMILTITIVAFLTSSALCFGMGWHQASPLVERCTQDEGGVGDAIAWMLILMFLLTSYAFIFAMGWKFGNPLNARKASNGTNGRADAIQLLFLLLFLINFGTWYFTGWALASGQPGRLKLNNVAKTFEYNNTFAEPSNVTDQAWYDLYPQTLFEHPAAPGEESTLSVFHQLACLNTMRHAYWFAYLALNNDNITISEPTVIKMPSPAHMSHCSELLRQSLMCNIDTTVESKEKGLPGVDGFGIKHQCKDWEQLTDWTAKTGGAKGSLDYGV